MTSRNLFSKLMKENLKRRLWTISLSVLLFFVALPIVIALSIGEEGIYNTRNNIVYGITQILAASNFFIILITIISAVVCGLSSFYYLHSKKKVDLYHSIPVRREKLFAVNYINGLLMYIVPYLINLLLAILIIQINGYMSGELLKISLIALVINFLFYWLIYTLTIIAVMLTGNIVISFFGIGVFLSYGPLLMFVKELYFMQFFRHYPSLFSEWKLFQFLSPLGSYLDLANIRFGYSYKSYTTILSEGLGLGIIKTIITVLVLLAVAVFLFIKRPSEAAGKAMSFSISKPIIKFLLVIPLTLLGGIIFRQIASNSGTTGWFIFGLLFTFFVVTAIIEIIFNFDIRAAFKHKRHLLLCAAVVSVITCIFQFDLFKYDSYLPDKDKIDYMSIDISGLDNDRSYVNFDVDNDGRYYINRTDYHLEHVKLTNIDAAYSLAQIGVEQENKSVNTNNYLYDVRIKYVLKNGKEAERNYQLVSKEHTDLLTAIFENKEFKEAHYQIFDFKAADIFNVYCENNKNSKELTLSESEIQELIDIYKQEISLIKLEDLVNQPVIANINFRFKNNQSARYEIYGNFTKTVEFLKAHGFNDFMNTSMDSVNSIEINYYNPYMMKEISNSVMSYSDKNEIEEILLNVIEQDKYWRNYSILDKEEYYDIFVDTDIDAYGNINKSHYFFRKDSVPDFVKEDFGITK